ncbi:MAG: DUF2865 domain-containing protein [Hyphomicrobiaceae bacterium]|nr:DUF2865 domain-containing protein [Hyphomicrobiaceae bacterium]
MRKPVILAAFVAASAPAFSGSAHSQSFFEQLFGGGSQPVYRPPSVAAPTQRLGVPESVQRNAAITRTEQDDAVSRRTPTPADDDGPADKRWSGGQSRQTMCVRTCDGYYWPVRYPARRKDLADDEAACRASCGTETKLYTRPDPGAPVEEMKDQNGRLYADSPTAFVYRKRLVDGCACKPMPWSDSEVARHERYALIEEERRIRVAEADRLAKEAVEAARIAALEPPRPKDESAGGSGADIVATDQGAAGDKSGLNSRQLADGTLAGAPPAITAQGSGTPLAERTGRPRRSAEGQAQARSKPEARTAAAAAPPQQPLAPRAPQRIARNSVQPGILQLPAGQPKFRYPGD